jgi:2,3-bisphosphoglycerate-independent phosphoglycerate mutase
VVSLKYVILIGDGMADYAIEELNGRTPLEVASTPNMDFIAREGRNGTALTIPNEMPAGSDVANLSLLGYDPRKYYTGRGPLEAASMGVRLEEDDVAFRCNLITERDGRILDYSAGHISTGEAEALIEALNEELGSDDVKFYAGVGYRHLLLLKCCQRAECTPPHDIVGLSVEEHLPRGDGARILRNLIRRSENLLKKHPVNEKRVVEHKNPANLIWPWGQGSNPSMPAIQQRYRVKGAVISAVDLIKGIGVYAGLEVIHVPGATGYFDTDYRAKAVHAVKALDRVDLVVIHVEAPDEAGHLGSIEEKIRAIENIDEHIAGHLLDQLPSYNDFKLLLTADHPTPIAVRTHTREPVPFALYSTDLRADYINTYSEKAAADGVFGEMEGWKIMSLLMET